MPVVATINLHPDLHSILELRSQVYDVICIGSGWAGRIIAVRCVAAGLSALVVEQELVGGDCPFWACVPSKALLRPFEALEGAKTVAGAKETLVSQEASLNVEAVFQRRDMLTSEWDEKRVLIPLVDGSGTEIVRGSGKVVGEKRIIVENGSNSVELQARHAVAVCTGSEPIIPEVPGLADAKP